MIYCLENDFVRVQIKGVGAELCSYYDKQTEREVMWQANPVHWKRHAPILFPIVGKVKNNSYKLENNTYNLNQHGFARDQNFNLIQQSVSSITLGIKANEETKKIFPFDFYLRVKYILSQKELKVIYEVENFSQQNIYFCIGAHPGFNCPFDNKTTFSDYQLNFEKKESSDRILLNSNGFRTGKRSNKWLSNQSIQLTENLFLEDALIFDDLESRYLLIESPKINEKVKVGWHNYPHMGIWKPLNNAPFICIEPWNGMADEDNLNNDFKDKYGVLNLNPDKNFECFYTIENIIE
ncbi:MAG: hypothetical protein CMP67_10000 [Flavobacteriales bacterium]|nr:hypothetical protein [Flavobacteriales bacterium]|tara:strand:+ start:1786 stop:2667 length:882 start_codon:yes stop_codon:yes gene_type:complete